MRATVTRDFAMLGRMFRSSAYVFAHPSLPSVTRVLALLGCIAPAGCFDPGESQEGETDAATEAPSTTSGSDTTTSGGTDASTTMTSDDGTSCARGAQRPCGTDEGVCEFGVETCSNGVWGSCEGSVQPGPRDCASSQDNDCNGTPDRDEEDHCECVIGETRACNEHPEQDGNGRCVAGEQVCEAAEDGTRSAWGDCEGDVGPLPVDSCSEPGDDSNCDGMPNGGCDCELGDDASCPNPDPETCAVECAVVDDDGDTQCVVTALDADGDGFFAACPADLPEVVDCDDSRSNVHPEGTEICNGYDDDCDGNIDLTEGLPLGGTTQIEETRSAPDVAYDARYGDFFWVAERGESGTVTLGRLTRTNIYAFGEVGPTSLGNALPQIAASGDAFGVVYTIPDRAGVPSFQASFSLLDSDGVELETTPLGARAGSDPSLAARPGGGWLVSFGRSVGGAADADQQEIGAVSSTGSYTAGTSPWSVSEYGATRVAAAESGGATIWQTSLTFNVAQTPNTIFWARFDSDGRPVGEPEQLAASGSYPDIATLGENYFMAWAVSTGISYTLRDSEGAEVCSGGAAFGDGLLGGDDAVAVDAIGDAIVLLATDHAGGEVGVFQIAANCSVLQHGLIPAAAESPDPREPERPSIAHGGDDVAFAWTEGTYDGHFRVVPSSLCN